MQSNNAKLGDLLVVVKPHPLSILFCSLPGLVMLLFLPRYLPELFYPSSQIGSRIFVAILLLVTLFFLWLGLRHVGDRAELYQHGFRFQKKTYLFSEIGPISWQHSSTSGYTRFADVTTLSFRHGEKTVFLSTRCLQDLSYQFHRTYVA